MGDSLLYGILPLAAASLAISPERVGILLSVNRLVRLLSNTWISSIFARFGPRQPFLAAAGLGTLTTLLYGLNWGFLTFVLARLGWGIAWSSLRQGGYQAVWTGGPMRTGRLMGLLWGIIRLGSAISVLIGGYLFDLYGYRSTVFVIVGLTALALPIALTIRWPVTADVRSPTSATGQVSFIEAWRTAMRDPLQREVVLIGALKSFFDAILVATAALYLAQQVRADAALAGLGLGVGMVAGAVLATRWLSDLAIGPLLGFAADRFGQLRMAVLLLGILLTSLTLSLLSGGLPALAAFLLVLILSTGVNVTLDAVANGVALRTASSPQHFVGVYATLSDGGSALGPLLALPLVSAIGFAPVYLPAGAILLATVIHLKTR
ncbi:MAG: MFS transporter [Caldilineaceae bacterium]|nr:MFS transporter [Caldilineaceae bacterium]